MALNKREVTVLCPYGRRVTIKSTATTSIGQIIEEACLKQKLDPLIYNLRHLKRVLDPSNTIQYSNIPNRAQLELIEAEKRRQELNVTVNLVTEEGNRLIEDFASSTTLEEILVRYDNNLENKFSLPTASSGASPFIVYTMRKIIGEELKSVTLKSLGLYGGRCMMRYGIQQKSENCSESPSSPIVIVQKKPEARSKPSDIHGKNSSADPPLIISEPMDCDAPQIHEVSTTKLTSVDVIEDTKPICNVITDDKPSVHQPEGSCDSPMEEYYKTCKIETAKSEVDNSLSELSDNLDEKEVIECETSAEERVDHENETVASKVIPLSDHDSVLFHLDEAPPTVHVDEDDQFFELSSGEVRSLHQENVKYLKDLEEAPLMTKQLRELEKDSRLLSAMNHYPITQVRICFPDRYAIQANFKPRNTVREVMEFLRPLLIRNDLDFYLYTFPRNILNPDISLVEANCIPKACLNFGCKDNYPSFLSEDALSKKSTYEAAKKSVIRSKKHRPLKQESDVQGLASSKSKQTSATKQAQEANQSQPSTQKPKWFKLGK